MSTLTEYRAIWIHHQLSVESGCPTRSASSPVEVQSGAAAAIAALSAGAAVTLQPATLYLPRIDA